MSSGWNPTPTAISGETRPTTSPDPRLGAVTPASSRSRVDLPDPLRPMTPTHSPGSIRRSMSRRAHSRLRRVRARRPMSRLTSIGASSYFTYRLETPVSDDRGQARLEEVGEDAVVAPVDQQPDDEQTDRPHQRPHDAQRRSARPSRRWRRGRAARRRSTGLNGRSAAKRCAWATE